MPDRTSLLRAAAVFALTLAVFRASGLLLGRESSPDLAYFDHLAYAFLHGRLHLDPPPGVRDLTLHEGRWYVPFPPLPALLLLPSIAWRGVSGTNVAWFSTVAGALSAALLCLLLDVLSRRGWTRLGPRENLWLTALFALGTVHWYVSVDASVWFLAQTCTVMMVTLGACLASFVRSPLPAGIALALAMWARPNAVLCWPLLAGLAAEHMKQQGRDVRAGLRRWSLGSAVPLALALLALFAYNRARFGSSLDFGYARQNVAPELLEDLSAYGQFHVRNVPRNLYAMLLAPPRWSDPLSLPLPDPSGMSLLLTTPAFVWILAARANRPLTTGAWWALGLSLPPILLYYNTGWVQFGYRFSLDFIVPVMVLMAVAAGRRPSRGLSALIALSVVVNAGGTYWWFAGRA
jgi:hypothetical protein